MIQPLDSTVMARPYARRDTADPLARDMRKRMAANRRRRERLEADLATVRDEAAQLANQSRGVLTYEDMADALGISRAMVGYLLAPDRAAG